MRKNLLIFLLIVSMLISLCACGETEKSSSSSDSSSTTTASSSATTTSTAAPTINGILFPKVAGMTKADATALLEGMGIVVAIQEKQNADVEPGIVFGSDHDEGEVVQKGDKVYLRVSKGEGYNPLTPKTDPLVEARGKRNQGDNSSYVPLNYTVMKAVWLSQFDMESVYAAVIQRKEEDFTSRIKTIFADIKDMGFNTVIVQLRPYGDSYYASEYYPWSSYITGSYGSYASYDPLPIMVREAHAIGLSFQAWINPMRCFETFDMLQVNISFKLREWYENSTKKNKYLFMVNERYYINPAYEEVRNLIIDAAAEIVRYYDVDGIHMDDYFYPNGTPGEIDQALFAKSGMSNITNFRKDCLNKLVSGMYSAIKAENPNVLYGIAPAGNMGNVRNGACLDIDTILANEGYVDYIMPQLYWGLEHNTAAFDTLYKNWSSLVKKDSIRFIVGMSLGRAQMAYSNGGDGGAGTGWDEWIRNKDVFKRCLEFMLTRDEFSGYCIFSYESFGESTKAEMDNFLPAAKKIPAEAIKY